MSSPNFSYRTQSHHLAQVRQHFFTCFKQSYTSMLSPEALQDLLDRLKSKDIGGLLPQADEHLLTYANDTRVSASAIWAVRSGTIYLWGVYVNNAMQRRGIATAMLAEIISATPYAKHIELSVLKDSADAVTFYDAMGFRILSETHYDLVPGHAKAAFIMRAKRADLAVRLN